MTTVQLIRALRQRDVKLTLVDGKLKLNAPSGVLDADLLDELRVRKAEIIEWLQADGMQPPAGPILQRVARSGFMPCSPAQQRLWLVQQAGAHGAAYNLPSALRLRGSLNHDALATALSAILCRHESLRTGIVAIAGEPMQDILHVNDPRLRIELEFEPVEQCDIDVRFDAIAAMTFDLEQPPMLRSRLLRVAEDDHVLLLNIHHIAADGWSMDVLVGELCEGYRAACENRATVLPELSIQYADYAMWQQRMLAEGVFDRQSEYWRHRLAGVTGFLALPTDHARPAQQSYRGGNQDVVIQHSLFTKLRNLAQSERCSLFMLLLAAFQFQLSRLTGDRDVVVGTPTANRSRPELEPLIGFFVNTLVLRTTIDTNWCFRHLLREVRELTLQDFAEQDLPFEQLVEILKPARSLSHSPLFQVAFTLGSGRARSVELPGLQVTPVNRVGRTAKFDLTLALEEHEEGIAGVFEYATDLFEATTVHRWAESYVALLEDICDYPDRSLALLGSGNDMDISARISIGVADTSDRESQQSLLPCLIAQHARERPHAIALVDDDISLTFSEFHFEATRLASRLRGIGFDPEARVGICLPRGPQAVVAMLAVWMADAAWVPLDSSYPLERLQQITTDADMVCVICDMRTADMCAHLQRPLLRLDDARNADVLDCGRPCSRPVDEQLAYLIYTSGSTGVPKGVMIGHRSLRLLVDWYASVTGMSSGSHHSQMAQFGFDAMVVETWGALAAGASLHFVNSEVRMHPRKLARWMEGQQIQIAFMPTPLAEEFLASGAEMPATLSCICCGGDRLKHHALPGGPRVLNCYGPTEATVISTASVVPDRDGVTISIGKPLPDTRAYVLDSELQPVVIGQPGELYVAGALLGRGYQGRPDLTAERFLPDPYADTPGARMYRTGDRVRWMPHGELEFLGRVDTQVKLRGFRIELGEVETVLAQLPNVGDVAVALLDSPAGSPTLVAYLTTAEKHLIDPHALRAALARRLPNYMVPSLLQIVESLPLLPSGKVNRNALPVPIWGETGTALTLPRCPEEQSLLEEWQNLLAVSDIGIHDDFFSLGGHSLLATRLLARIRTRFAVELSLAELFDAPTIAQLAALVASRGQHKRDVSAVVPVDRSEALPLSYAQQRLWFLAQLEPDSDAYHMPVVLRFLGKLDVAAMQAALADLVDRHEVLRARITEIDGEPRQQFDSWPEPLELRSIDTREIESALREFMAARFDFATDPVLRSRLFRIAPDEHVLALVVHHIVADGWSMNLISRDLAGFYTMRATGQVPSLPVLQVQYGDYAHWQRNSMQGMSLERDLQYWVTQLKGVPPALNLPCDGPGNHRGRSKSSSSESLRLDPTLVAMLRQFTQVRGATLFMGFLAALKVLLWRWSGQSDICVGTPINNRDRAELEPVVGLFLGTLALRTDVGGARNFEEILQRVRETAVEAYAHQHVPFEQIVDALKLERNLGRHPLFQVFFNMIEQGSGNDPVLPALEVSSLMPPEQGTKFDFTLYANVRGDEVDLQVHFDSQLFSTDRMVGMLCQLQSLLCQMLEAPNVSLLEHQLRIESDRNTLPDPSAPLGQGWQGAITTWFEHACALGPSRIAVLDAHQSLSYEALDQASNRVAHWLREAGIGPGDVVALHSSRCAAIAVGLLGVLKSGAAFMLLDSSYPMARVQACVDVAAPLAWLHVGEHVCEQELDTWLTNLVPRRLRLDRHLTALQGLPAHAPPLPSLGAHSLSHIAFTSGSSGRPKAIAGRHGPFTRFLPWFQQEFGIGPEDRFSVLSGLSHDPMQRDVLWPLMLGGTACFPDPELMVPGALAQWMHDECITVANLTPAMTRVLTDISVDACLPDLKRAFIVGDVLTRDVVEKLDRVAPDCRIQSFYGATETQWALSWEPVNLVERNPVIALGRGIPDVQLLLMNSAGALAGVGELAEIYIRSPHLSSGYWHDESLTSERFMVNSRTGDPEDRMYRTGDLGRYLPDGRVQGVGRADRQVSVRGFRIELGEIEVVLSEHPGVRHAAVIGCRDAVVGAGVSALVAFVAVRVMGAPADQDLMNELRQRLRIALPEYMHPTRIELLTEMPLSANGKVDYSALQQRSLEPMAPARAGTLPQGEMEARVARVFGEILGCDIANREDHFFELGGNSLLAMRVVARLRAALGWMVPVRLVFEQPTVAGLAVVLDADGHGKVSIEARIWPRDRSVPAPLSFAQQRLWFLHQLDEGSHTYNMLLPLRLRGALGQDAIARSLAMIVERHEALRTIFVTHEGVPSQQVLPKDTAIDFDSVVCDDSALAVAMEKFANRPFALEREPAIRARLFRLESDVHVLAISMHHIISDGWSMAVLLRELGECYAAIRAGREPELPVLGLQFSDFANWQQRHHQGDELDADRRFWRAHLEGAPSLLELPFDRPRPMQQSHRGDKLSICIDGELYAAARELCRDTSTTPFMLLMAVWQLMLSRLAGVHDLSVGFPVAGRDQTSLEPLIGLFANTLVLRTEPRPHMCFSEYLANVRNRCLAIFSHQDLPFESMVEMLQPQRGLTHTPLFQVMFNLQNIPASDSRQFVDGIVFEPVSRGGEAARFDLTLVLCDDTNRWFGDLEFCIDLFDQATVEAMAERFVNLLAAIVDAPDTQLALLPMLTAAERERLDHASAVAAPETRLAVHQWVEHWARTEPSQVAVSMAGEHIDYRQLNARANQLAHWLSARNIGCDCLVAMMLPRTPASIIAALAVLKSGAAFLPIDPDAPMQRVQQMLDNAMPALLLTQQGCSPTGVQAFDLDALLESTALCAMPAHDLDLFVHPDQLAYAIYTSGSTGMPKAAMLVHAGWSNLAAAQAILNDVDRNARVLQLVSPAFDVAVGDLALAFGQGATLVLAPDEARRNPDLLQQVLQNERISHVQMPVSLLASLMLAQLPDLRVLVAGGEAMPTQVASHWGERVKLFNAYGPTEATVMATCTRIRPVEPISIGQGIEGVRIYVLDAQLQPVADGVIGEIWIAGAGLARGYLRHPALTATVILPDPFADAPGQRMYRSGDLGRWRRDGRLEIHGRIDEQIKLRGYRIELGEIEAVLRRCLGVDEAAVCVHASHSEQRRLVAYVVCDDEHALASIRANAETTLMSYMRPSAWVRLSALPKTANGKVDRRSLPVPDEFVVQIADVAVPRSPIEIAMVGIWCRLLGREQVGLHDSFFDLGGDSILSIRAIALVAQAGWKISTRQMYEHQCIARLAAVARPILVSQLEPASVSGPLTMTPIQHWFFETVRVAPERWNQSLLLEPTAWLGFDAVAAAIQVLQRQHDSLRMRFIVKEDVRRAWLATEDQRVVLERIDIHAATSEQFAELLAQHADHIQGQFKFDGRPLFRAVWFECSALRLQRLWLLAHHLLIDAVSWRIVLGDLQQLLAEAGPGASSRLPARTQSLLEWSQQLQAHALGPSVQSSLAYWCDLLSAIDFGVEFPVEASDEDGNAVKLSVELNASDTELLLKHCNHAHGTGINDLLLTAVSTAYSRWQGGVAMHIAMESHGRDLPFDDVDVSRTMGWFTASYPVLLKLPDADDPGARIEAIKAQLRQVPHAGLSYGMLRYLTRNPRLCALAEQAGEAPISFNYLGQFDAGEGEGGALFSIAGESTGRSRDPRQRRPHAIDLIGMVSDGCLQMDFRYGRSQLASASVRQFADAFLSALREIIRHCLDAVSTDTPDADDQRSSERAQAARLTLLPLNAGFSGSPLFCVHPAGGSVDCYRPLAVALSNAFPVFGLQAPSLDGAAPLPPSFVEMATFYVDAIRHQQVHGPYRLLGWSQGGTIAQEIACQLQRLGESVEVLFLVDSGQSKQMLRVRAAHDEAEELLEYLQRDGLVASDMSSAGSNAGERFEALVEQAHQQGLLPEGLSATQVRSVLATHRGIAQATASHEASTFSGRTVLLRAEDGHLFGHLGERLGWSPEICTDWQLVDIPGDHFSCVRPPHVHALARHILRLLQDVGQCNDSRRSLARDAVA